MRSPIEALESRRLFAVNLVNGILTIDGTPAADSIRVTQSNGTITVRDDSTTQSFAAADVDEVVVNAGDGDDRVRLEKLNTRPAVVEGGAGDDRICGGAEDDILRGGDGNDRIFGKDGDDQLEGGAGNDLVSGDFGDDDLSGGDGSDRINGGFGIDSTELAIDTITGVEIFPGLPPGFVVVGRPRVVFGTNFFDGTLVIPVSGPAISDPLRPGFFPFPPNFVTPGFAGFQISPVTGQLLPTGVTGLEPTIGVSTISPLLSRQPSGNQLIFRPNEGLFIRSGGNAEFQLNQAGAILRQPMEVIAPLR